jgi:hypothetical protein
MLTAAQLTSRACVWRCRASNGSGLGSSQGRSSMSLAPMIEHQTHNFSAYGERGDMGGVRAPLARIPRATRQMKCVCMLRGHLH